MEKYTALITGASAGIGVDLAKRFAADGHDVVLVARRGPPLEALAGELASRHRIKATALAADLARPEAPWALVERLRGDGVAPDVVVNNAGFGVQGRFADLPFERQMNIVQVNVTALTALTRLLLPDMLRRNRGGVLNVASTAAFQPGPLMAVYYATKAYVESFTEAIAEEVRDSALRVSCLCPGPTTTEFQQVAEMTHTNLFRRRRMTSDDVARIGYEGWKRGAVVVVPGFTNRMGMLWVRLTPRATVRRVVRRLNDASHP
jgi:short-subunit dehydrogenase